MSERVKGTKKLTRGLKDISPYVFSTQEELQGKVIRNKPEDSFDHLVQVAPPARRAMTLPEVFCFTVLPFSAYGQLLNSHVFVSEIASLFSEIYALSFAPGRSHSNGVNTNGANTSVRKFSVPPFQIHDILHPEPMAFGEQAPEFDPEKRVCLFLEPKSLFQFHTDLFQLLDHVILSVSAQSSDTMVAAYQMLSACLHRNPTLHFSLLIEGFASDDATEMIYERFAKITSQFLGCEIDFLGWFDQTMIQINRDLLVDLGHGRLIRKPMKLQLFQLLANESLLEIA
ncbi:MAG: hypothetical protein HY582_01425 [Candidatus Omnitrophica bacterium]|nr:hypothetical protein [Candidatus Omnitrophota bacterium]